MITTTTRIAVNLRQYLCIDHTKSSYRVCLLLPPLPAEIALGIKKLEKEVVRKELQFLQARLAAAATYENSYKMIDPEKYYGGPEELETFLTALRTRFSAHAHLFPNDTVKVSYAMDNLDYWANHRDS
jgi:hypothetical protein